jgi:predicted amidohydrolase
MTSVLTVSVATLGIRRYDTFAQFRNHMELIVREAAEAGSRLLLLPELACVGLLWMDEQASETRVPQVSALYRRALTPRFGEYKRVLSQLAMQYKITIAGASFWLEQGGQGANVGFFFKSDGTIVEQLKLHPTLGERAIYTVGGSEIKVCEVDGVRVGMLICYDIQFPEVTRFLVDAGVEVLLVPSLTDERGVWRVHHCAHARAVENQLFVCVSPLIGDLGIPVDRPVHGRGAAFIACPIDNRFKIQDGTLARAAPDVESILHSSLDLELLRKSRARSEITQLADRRPDLYSSLLCRT